MTDYKKAFVDTAPFIYFIEKDENNPQYYDKVKKFSVMDMRQIRIRMICLWLFYIREVLDI